MSRLNDSLLINMWLVTATLLVGCGAEMSGDGAEYQGGKPVDPNSGKALFGAPLPTGKADSVHGRSGPRATSVDASSQVWKVTRRWYHKASEPGLAWAANSSLTWDEKYRAWVESMEKTKVGNATTFTLTTPWGKKLKAPALECAEAAMFLRAAFASWYGLPFLMEAYSSTHGAVYFGHFGIVDQEGRRLSGAPSFSTRYHDYTAGMAGKSAAAVMAAWPRDSILRSKALTKLKDDTNDFIEASAYSGAYFDEIFLNKRVGYFLLHLLTNFGSIHVASDRNAFNLKPEVVAAGDVLVMRWQRKGIGHVMVVKTVTNLGDGNLAAEIIFGSMPRVQPEWYDAQISKAYFTSNKTGGEGTNLDGHAYVKLGGGLKRWRTPVIQDGRWVNIVPTSDRSGFISSVDDSALKKRPKTFEKLLGSLTPVQQRDVYLQQIKNARQNLELRPASCANRTRREEAFARLVKLNKESFNISKEETDNKYRTLADYVLAELQYNKSKTCCWNSTTREMYDLVMALNRKRIAAAQGCQGVLVFKARNGSYNDFKQYAAAQGKANIWRAWSADETCPQANDPDLTDAEATHTWTPLCSLSPSATSS